MQTRLKLGQRRCGDQLDYSFPKITFLLRLERKSQLAFSAVGDMLAI